MGYYAAKGPPGEDANKNISVPIYFLIGLEASLTAYIDASLTTSKSQGAELLLVPTHTYTGRRRVILAANSELVVGEKAVSNRTHAPRCGAFALLAT